MSAQSNGIRDLVKHVAKTEHKFNLSGERNARTLPFMPYQPADFIGIIWECMPELTGDMFLDVGAGPGTKTAIARTLFGLKAWGIEIEPALVRAADDPLVTQKDALDFTMYDQYDLIWLYRPFRDDGLERRLEELVVQEMKPGAILAGGSWETDPGPQGLAWEPIVDDTLNNPNGPGCIWRGAWRKPQA